MEKPQKKQTFGTREDPFITGLRDLFRANATLKMATVSRMAGLDPSTIGKMLGGTTETVQYTTAAKIAQALGRTVESISNNLDLPPPAPAASGFAEAQAEPWVPPAHGAAADPIAFLKQGIRHPASYRITRPSPSLGLLAGDVVIIDLASPPKDGDIILVGAVNISDHSAAPDVITLLRRYHGSFALSADPGEPMPILSLEGHDASWRGTVRAMFRTNH